MIRLLKERFSVCALLLAMCISCVQRPDIEGTLPPEIHSVHLSLSETTAVLEAQIRSHNSSFLEAGFYFGAAKDKMEKRPCQAYGSTFSLTSEGLAYETDYYYCAYISNGINEIKTDILKFTTGEEPIFIRNIEFEDPYAELLCIRHYDSDRDGYLSYEEAAAVTSVEQLGEEANRKHIASFNELKHFTSLREFSLPGCHSIRSVTLPENLETIGEDAFSEWDSIKEIIIPDNVRTIGEQAFNHMGALESLQLPDSLKRISSFAITYCDRLTELHFPEKADTIEAGAVYRCPNVSRFTGAMATEDGRLLVKDDIVLCFAPGGLETFTIPENIIALGSNSMRGAAQLKELHIGSNLVMIGENAVAEMSSLEKMTLRRKTPPLCLNEPRLNKTLKIYVPAEALEDYKITIHWRNYKKNIHPLEDYVTN